MSHFGEFIDNHPVFVFGCFLLVVALLTIVHDISGQWARRRRQERER